MTVCNESMTRTSAARYNVGGSQCIFCGPVKCWLKISHWAHPSKVAHRHWFGSWLWDTLCSQPAWHAATGRAPQAQSQHQAAEANRGEVCWWGEGINLFPVLSQPGNLMDMPLKIQMCFFHSSTRQQLPQLWSFRTLAKTHVNQSTNGYFCRYHFRLVGSKNVKLHCF